MSVGNNWSFPELELGRDGREAQRVGYLLCNCENLGLNPHTHIKARCGFVLIILTMVGWRAEDPRILLSSQPSHNSEIWVQ